MDALKTFLSGIKTYAIITVLLVLLFASGWYWSSCNSGKEYQLLVKANGDLSEQLTISKNETQSINSLLEEESGEAEFYRLMIAGMEVPPAEVRYLVKTRTIFKPSDPETITVTVTGECEAPELPPYTYRWENGLPVASFSSTKVGKELSVQHTTAEVSLETNVVVSEGKTSVIIKGKSSLSEDTVYDIKVDEIASTKIRKGKLFEPHIQLNLTGSLDTAPVGGDLTAGISVPLVHFLEDRLDFFAPKASVGSKTVRVGADLLGYNIGYDLPVITDLWLSIGTSIKLNTGNYYPSVDISIGSKF